MTAPTSEKSDAARLLLSCMAQQGGSEAAERFAAEYGRMSEEELLGLARSYDTLIEAAQDALRAEFARRGLQAPLVEDADAPESRRLVTVRRYRDLSEAIVARSVLESAGIYCFLQDENLIRLDWQVSNFIGGLRLQVRPGDVAAATALLNQPIPESIALEGGGEYLQPHCPRCGSTDVSFGASRGAALASVTMLGIPLPLGGASWECGVCGWRWVDAEEDAE